MSDLYGGVTVDRWPFGRSDFSMATAEQMPDDTLVVYHTEDGTPWQRFAPGSWFNATVQTCNGELSAHFVNRVQPERTSVRPPCV